MSDSWPRRRTEETQGPKSKETAGLAHTGSGAWGSAEGDGVGDLGAFAPTQPWAIRRCLIPCRVGSPQSPDAGRTPPHKQTVTAPPARTRILLVLSRALEGKGKHKSGIINPQTSKH